MFADSISFFITASIRSYNSVYCKSVELNIKNIIFSEPTVDNSGCVRFFDFVMKNATVLFSATI